MDKVFSLNIDDILGIMISAVIVYIILVCYIRLLGKRSTSELNSFDWIVTVSMGSLFATSIINKDISIIEGCISILVLLLLQFITTKIVKKSKWFRKIVKATPSLLLFKGDFIEENLKNERILKAEIYAAIRQKGLKSIKKVYAVVLETNSKISVIANDDDNEIGYSLQYVNGLPAELQANLKKQESIEGINKG
ncbi:uncharacterized membrane protein YcaP (DUF421 family) [Flavobacterium sp. PL11]|jgi:uncharacterized membrane protein YcaP (DUF421 family)|uniref:DUF421 domain-containing protein n=1 Tax=Flavobacterium sp. PL11 TaxID=3071717 RepID=UPI002E038B64|nr:uncharacterized membrane protein YcaP (DUF421 family) [Flavobacterium sp. PL11]